MKKKTKFSTKKSTSSVFWKATLYVITFPIRLVCYILIYFYKILISPFLPKSCRYLPSCSTYALEAIKRYGIIKGVVLASKRIKRCTPKNKSGYDPVPASIEGEMKWLI